MDKVRAVLKSRKFYVLLASLIAIAQSFVQGNIDDWQAIQAVVAAGAFYSLGTGIESGLERNK
jgi:hypothetical protein